MAQRRPPLAGTHPAGGTDETGAELRRRVVGLAVPMAVAQLLAIAMPVVIVGILGWMGDQAIQVRSLYLPLAFLFFAVQTAFDVTSQTMTALRTGRGERDVGADVTSVALVWLVTGLVLAGALSLAAPALADLLGATANIRGPFVTFLRWMSLANLTLAWPVLCASALRGTGRAGPAAKIMLVGTLVEVAALAVLGLGAGLGPAALPMATALNGILAGAYGTRVLARAGLLRGRGWRPETLGHLLRTGLPVSLSSAVMFGMSFAFVMMLKPFGPDVISGFAIASTIQNVVIMPGIVVGSASAIVMNQRRGAGDPRRLSPVLGTALRVTLVVYAVITPALWLLRGWIGNLATSSPRIAGETAHYFAIVGPSYLVLGLVLTALMALEQIGGGLIAVTATSVYVVGSVAVGAIAGHGAHGPTPLYAAMSGMNAAGLLAVAAAVAFVRRGDRRRHAHPGSAQARLLRGAGAKSARRD
jgi:Na+-driven multidrug efflux pump